MSSGARHSNVDQAPSANVWLLHKWYVPPSSRLGKASDLVIGGLLARGTQDSACRFVSFPLHGGTGTLLCLVSAPTMVSNASPDAAATAAHESQSSQSLSDTSCSRDQPDSMQVAGGGRGDGGAHDGPVAQEEPAASQRGHEDAVKNCKKRQRADDEAPQPEQLLNPSDAKAVTVAPQSPPKQQEQQQPSQQQPWWLPQCSAASPHPLPSLPAQSPFLGRMLDGQLLDFGACNRLEHQQHQRQIIRPMSALPHDKSFFSLGIVDSLQCRGGSEAGESSSSSKFTNSSSITEGGRKSFVEWRPLVPPESAGSGFRPPAAPLPSWSIGHAAAAAAYHHHHQQSALNYFLAPPLAASTTTYNNHSNRALLGNSPLTYSPGMTQTQHAGGWGTPHQFAAMQSLAAGMLPGQDRLPSTSLLFLGPSATVAAETAAIAAAIVSVVVDGRLTSGSINLHEHQSYQSFARAVRCMFQDLSSEALPQEDCNLSNAVPGHIIAYEDAEGDLLLAGDLSWSDFVRAAKRIRILPAKGRSVLPVP